MNIYTDGLAQDCSNSSVLAMELLQSGTKALIYADLFQLNIQWVIPMNQAYQSSFVIFVVVEWHHISMGLCKKDATPVH